MQTTAYLPSTLTVGCHAQSCEQEARDVGTNMVQERGRLSSLIYQGIKTTDPFLRVFERTKEFFPSYMGDTLTKLVLDVPGPNERDVLDWRKVQAARPGYNPCCVTMKEIPYGSRYVHGCLYVDAWKTPPFCKIDLAFKHRGPDQIRQQFMVMTKWSRDIWMHWSCVAFQRSVQCVILNKSYGHPEELGQYPIYARPTSILTFQHLEMLFDRFTKEPMHLEGRPITEYELIFIGRNEYTALEDKYMLDVAARGMRSQSVHLPEIGEMRYLQGSKYFFVLRDTPRRFRDPEPGESWEDAIVPSTEQSQDATHGTITKRNEDYFDASVSLYAESVWFNMSSVTWLVPPSAMVSSSQLFPASNFAGDFRLINPQTDCDPWQETVYFAARFMSGMIGEFPRTARCILSLAVHMCAEDIDVDCRGERRLPEPLRCRVLTCCKHIEPARMQLLLKGELPNECPPGHALFLVSEKGRKYLIDQVVNQAAYAGDEIFTHGGTVVVVDLKDADAATCRDDCDPWEYVACLPANTPVDMPQSDPCTTCGGGSGEPQTPTCTHHVAFVSDNVVNFRNAGGTDLLTAPSGGYDADSYEAALQAYLDANGGGTVEVTPGTADNGWVWEVRIEGNPALLDYAVAYEDGFGVNAVPLESQNCNP